MGLITLGLLAGSFAAFEQTLLYVYVPSKSNIHKFVRFNLLNLIFVLFSLRFIPGWTLSEFGTLTSLVWGSACLMLVLLHIFDYLQCIDREQAAKQ